MPELPTEQTHAHPRTATTLGRLPKAQVPLAETTITSLGLGDKLQPSQDLGAEPEEMAQSWEDEFESKRSGAWKG